MAKVTNRIKWGTVVWKILTDRKFRYSFSEVILYSLINAEKLRGDLASGIVLFKVQGYEHNILK